MLVSYYSTLANYGAPECLRQKAQNLPLTSKCKKCLKRQKGIIFYPETWHFTRVSARCTRIFYSWEINAWFIQKKLVIKINCACFMFSTCMSEAVSHAHLL
jgi:hypothetical protein